MSMDYADDVTIDNMNCTLKETNLTRVKVVDNVSYVGLNNEDSVITPKSSDKIHTIKEKTKKKAKVPVISMWAKPSVRSKYSYTWHHFTFIDYCPHCRHYYSLLKNPKRVPEREYTCRYCGADYCAVTGKEKYDYSHYYLTKV